MTKFVIYIFAFLHLNTVLGGQTFLTTPKNQTALIGDTVVFHCGISNKSGLLQWTKDGFGLGLQEDLVHMERYSMKSSHDFINHDLEIQDVTLEDEGVFQCQVSPGVNEGQGIRSQNAFLTVNVAATFPFVIQGKDVLVQENQETQLDCISKEAKPPAKVIWIDYNGNKITEGVQVISEMFEDEKRFSTRSILRFLGNKNLHNKSFTCEAYNLASKEIMITQVRAIFIYLPIVTLEILPLVVHEFEEIEAICKVMANPPVKKYSWQLNNQMLDGEDRNKLIISNISREYHQNILTCFAENVVGKSGGHSIISLFYGPRFRVSPQDVHVEIGTKFYLYCDCDGNPSPLIFWIHEATQTIVYYGKNYTKLLSHYNHGAYICQAQVQGYAPIMAKVNVYVKGPPKIVSKAVQFGGMGENFSIDCVAVSTPSPKFITWTRFEKKTILDKLNHDIKNETTSVGMRSVLMVYDAKSIDFGEYECTVTNDYGSDSIEIFLIERKFGKRFVVMICTAVLLVVLVSACITFHLLNMCFKNKSDDSELKDLDCKRNTASKTSGECTTNLSANDNQMNDSTISSQRTNNPLLPHNQAVDCIDSIRTLNEDNKINLMQAFQNNVSSVSFTNFLNDLNPDVCSKKHKNGTCGLSRHSSQLLLSENTCDELSCISHTTNVTSNTKRNKQQAQKTIDDPNDSIVYKTEKKSTSPTGLTRNIIQPSHYRTEAQVHYSPMNLQNCRIDLNGEENPVTQNTSATNYQQSTSPQASAARPSASNSLTFAENNLCRSGIRTLDSTHFRDEEPRVSSNASNERSKLLQEIRNGINLKSVQSGTLQTGSNENTVTTKLKPVQKSFKLGSTSELGQAIAHAIELRNKSLNLESSCSDSLDDEFLEEDWK